jgi:hypothetical protein
MYRYRYQNLPSGEAVCRLMDPQEILPEGWTEFESSGDPDMSAFHKEPFKSSQAEVDPDPPRLWSLSDLVQALNIDSTKLSEDVHTMLQQKQAAKDKLDAAISLKNQGAVSK